MLLGRMLFGRMLLGSMLLLGGCLFLVVLCLGSISLGKRMTTNIFFSLVDAFTTSRVANTNGRGLTTLLGSSLFGMSLLGFSSGLFGFSSGLLASLLGSAMLFGRTVLLGGMLLGGAVFLGSVLFGGRLFIVFDRNVTYIQILVD